MNEKKSVWFCFIGSFSPKFYKNVVSQSFARSFGYLSLLVLAISLILSAKITLDTRIAIQKSLEWINTEFARRIPEFLPEINIKNGRVSSHAVQPFIHERKEFAFILDTTGTILSLDKYKNGILLTEYALIVKHTERGKTQTEEYDLSKIKSFKIAPGKKEGEFVTLNFEGRKISLTQNNIERWSDIIGKAMFPIMAVVLFLYFLLAKIFHLLIFSLLSLIVSGITNAKLNYDNLLNIGILAMTPPVVFALLVAVFNLRVPFEFIYIGLYSLFLVMAISQCKDMTSYYLPQLKK